LCVYLILQNVISGAAQGKTDVTPYYHPSLPPIVGACCVGKGQQDLQSLRKFYVRQKKNQYKDTKKTKKA